MWPPSRATEGRIFMSNIAAAFAHGKAFIPFITCGDPDLETTAACVRAAVAAGADLIELGIPFSDPTAEGPVIQEANLRALSGGVTTDKILGLVRDLRRDVSVPMVFMTYANVVFSYGTERFISTCAEAGMDGLVLPDVPFEKSRNSRPSVSSTVWTWSPWWPPRRRTGSPPSAGRRTGLFTWSPAWGSPACEARSPRTWGP